MRSVFATVWRLLVHNRIALAAASLLWLVFRSGSQPRRLSYPCQQAAALNVTAVLSGLIPALFLARGRRCPHALPRAVLVRRQVLIAACLFGAAFFGVEAYQYAKDIIPDPRPDVPIRTDAATPATVAIVHATELPPSDAQIETMVQEAVALAGGLESVISPGDSVVLKPNLVVSNATPGDGVTTDPRVLRAVVRLAQVAGAGSVTIAEGTASSWNNVYTARDVTRYAFHDSGYDLDSNMIDDETGVPLVDLNDAGGLDQHDPSKVTLVTIPNGVLRTQYYVPNVLLNCDVLITVPTLKNHSNAGFTMALKNRVGCAPSDIYHAQFDPYKQQLKWSLVHSITSGFPRNVTGEVYPVPSAPTTENQCVNYSIVDLNLVRPQDFVVVDGLVGIMDGPVGTSDPKPNLGLILAGRDSVAMDTVGHLTLGYDPTYSAYVSWSNQRGLGTMDTSIITVVGSHVASVRRDFPLGHGGSGITTRADTSSPWINTINLGDGQRVYGTIDITGGGFGDDRGVVKAELYVDGELISALPHPGNPFTFTWDSTTVAPGSHDIKLTVYDAALNEGNIIRQVAANDPYAQADFNRDFDVDMEDYAKLQACMTGDGLGPPPAGCEGTDLDYDGDVDPIDVEKFRLCLTGAGIQADPLCLEP